MYCVYHERIGRGTGPKLSMTEGLEIHPCAGSAARECEKEACRDPTVL